jgi:hypothetical protein
VLLWYIGLSVLFVALVFRSAGIDYRLVALGSLVPLLADVPVGYRACGHMLLPAVALLALVMVATIGRRRLVRRRLLCLPIGMFAGLVLSGAFANERLFWWPFLGTSFPHDALLGPPAVVVVEELAGLVACWVLVGLYDLYLPGPRRELARTGRLRPAAGDGPGSP